MVSFLQKVLVRGLAVLLISAACSPFNYANAQASFTVVCPQKTIGKNDYLQIKFKVDHASSVSSINPPDFKNFTVVDGPNQESGMTSINGKVDQYVSIGYVLHPDGPGTYTIGAATAQADGKQLQTSPIQIQVTKKSAPSSSSATASANSGNPFPGFPSFPNLNFDLSPAAPSTRQFDDYILKKGENVSEKIKKNLFLKLDVSKTSCYVGEPIVASYKLYTRLQSQSTITDAPSFDGFSVNDLDLNDDNSGKVEQYNGRDYNVYTLRTVELYPLRGGTFTLEPVKADNDITFVKQSYLNNMQPDMMMDMMQSFLNVNAPKDAVTEEHVSLQSPPVKIVVKPLPTENKPVDFKGAVGEYKIEASLEKTQFSTDDAGNLDLVISGAGNIQLINAPRIIWPKGLDGFDATIKDGIDKNAIPFNGKKTFTYPFTASAAGHYTIPSVSFSFFDPATGSYQTIKTDSLSLTVTKGKGVPAASYAVSQNPPGGFRGFLNTYGMFLIAAMILAGGLLFWLGQRKKQSGVAEALTANNEAVTPPGEAVPKEMEFVIPENPLQEAGEQLTSGNSAPFYYTMDHAMKKYLASKFKVPVEELNKKRIQEELDRCNVGLGTSLRLTSLLEQIEINLYAPASGTHQMREVYEKAGEVISLLNKQVIS